MSQINRTGTFRFQVVDSGIKSGSRKDPKSNVVQWVAQLQATEYYDEETEQWIDWSKYDEREITCYLTLFGKDKQTIFHAQQLQKALGWSGAGFDELETKYVADVIFQGRVEENTYEDTTTLKIVQVDSYDAVPGRTLQKLDFDEVKNLNAKFASQLRELSGGTKPKSVDKTTAKAAAKERLAGQKVRGEAAEARVVEQEKKSKPKLGRPPKPPKPPAKVAKAKSEQCDKGQAWIDCCQKRNENIDNKTLEEQWHAVVDSLGGEDIIEEKGLWAKVRDGVVAKVGGTFI